MEALPSLLLRRITKGASFSINTYTHSTSTDREPFPKHTRLEPPVHAPCRAARHLEEGGPVLSRVSVTGQARQLLQEVPPTQPEHTRQQEKGRQHLDQASTHTQRRQEEGGERESGSSIDLACDEEGAGRVTDGPHDRRTDHVTQNVLTHHTKTQDARSVSHLVQVTSQRSSADSRPCPCVLLSIEQSIYIERECVCVCLTCMKICAPVPLALRSWLRQFTPITPDHHHIDTCTRHAPSVHDKALAKQTPPSLQEAPGSQSERLSL